MQHGFVESTLEKGLYVLPGDSGPRCVLSTHVDELCVAFDTRDVQLQFVLASLEKGLRLRCEPLPGTYCGRFVSVTDDTITVTQPKACNSLDTITLTHLNAKRMLLV